MSDKGTHSYSNRHRMHENADNWTILDSAIEALWQNDKADVEHYVRELYRENIELRRALKLALYGDEGATKEHIATAKETGCTK